MGSRYIARHLHSTLGIDVESGLSFFAVEPKSSQLTWPEWLKLFNEQVRQHDLQLPSIKGAIDTYRWLIERFNSGAITNAY